MTADWHIDLTPSVPSELAWFRFESAFEFQDLQNATYALSQQMYSDTSASDGGSNRRQTEPDGDVVEGTYTEL